MLLDNTAIRHIHLFDSRNSAFKDDAVLQENIIIFLEKNGDQREVTVSLSNDDTFSDMRVHQVPFNQIVKPGDSERFIHIPVQSDTPEAALPKGATWSLDEIGLQVSTGPVVDFRVREYLRAMPEPGSVPLIYPGHFSGQTVNWPRPDFKKSNALMGHHEISKWLYPSGYYTVVRRFSTKEESRRIVANVVTPEDFNFSALGFENHLNVFHSGKQGLSEDLARGLGLFLNSSAVDAYFRRFNGHTQVNATDLRSMKYPSRAELSRVGQWAKSQRELTQGKIDSQLGKIA